CKTGDVAAAARFWGAALGRPGELGHPGRRGPSRMLETPRDAPMLRNPRGEHDSRAHRDRETDGHPAEGAPPQTLRATLREPLAGRLCCGVRTQRRGRPKNATRWE